MKAFRISERVIVQLNGLLSLPWVVLILARCQIAAHSQGLTLSLFGGCMHVFPLDAALPSHTQKKTLLGKNVNISITARKRQARHRLT